MILMPMLMPMIIIGLAAVHTTQQCNGQPQPGAEGIRQRLLARLRLGCQGTRAIWLASQVALGTWAVLLLLCPVPNLLAI